MSQYEPNRVPDYDTTAVITSMIDGKPFEKQKLWEKLDFDRNKEYFHIMPHEEPHSVRRRAIMEKYRKQIEPLMKPNIKSLYLTIFIVALQLGLAWYMQYQNWTTFIGVMYIVGATANHTAQVLIHDLTHYTCFESIFWNKVLACIICIPTAVPSAITFGRYHSDHHYYLGVAGVDADLPTEWEIKTFKTPLTKLFYIAFQPLFYALRPMIQQPKALSTWEALNWLFIVLADILIYKFVGGYALLYLLLSTWFSMGLHPASAHTIAEHYEFVKGQESYNYYGIWNFFNVNLGYHTEHHDFPSMPMWNLPEVRKICPEFYEDLPYHTSYLKVLWKYITDKNLGSFARIDISNPKQKGD